MNDANLMGHLKAPEKLSASRNPKQSFLTAYEEYGRLTPGSSGKNDPEGAFLQGWRDYAAERQAYEIKHTLARWLVAPLCVIQRGLLFLAGQARRESEKNCTFLAVTAVRSQLYKLPQDLPLEEVYDRINWWSGCP